MNNCTDDAKQGIENSCVLLSCVHCRGNRQSKYIVLRNHADRAIIGDLSSEKVLVVHGQSQTTLEAVFYQRCGYHFPQPPLPNALLGKWAASEIKCESGPFFPSSLNTPYLQLSQMLAGHVHASGHRIYLRAAAENGIINPNYCYLLQQGTPVRTGSPQGQTPAMSAAVEPSFVVTQRALTDSHIKIAPSHQI